MCGCRFYQRLAMTASAKTACLAELAVAAPSVSRRLRNPSEDPADFDDEAGGIARYPLLAIGTVLMLLGGLCATRWCLGAAKRRRFLNTVDSFETADIGSARENRPVPPPDHFHRSEDVPAGGPPVLTVSSGIEQHVTSATEAVDHLQPSGFGPTSTETPHAGQHFGRRLANFEVDRNRRRVSGPLDDFNSERPVSAQSGFRWRMQAEGTCFEDQRPGTASEGPQRRPTPPNGAVGSLDGCRPSSPFNWGKSRSSIGGLDASRPSSPVNWARLRSGERPQTSEGTRPRVRCHSWDESDRPRTSEGTRPRIRRHSCDEPTGGPDRNFPGMPKQPTPEAYPGLAGFPRKSPCRPDGSSRDCADRDGSKSARPSTGEHCGLDRNARVWAWSRTNAHSFSPPSMGSWNKIPRLYYRRGAPPRNDKSMRAWRFTRDAFTGLRVSFGAAAVAGLNAKVNAPTIEELIAGMLLRLEQTKGESLAVKRTVFRDLQRQLHPDKNTDCMEAATHAFQQLMELRESYLRCP